MNRHDQALLTENLHRVPNGYVSDSVLACERPLSRQLPDDLTRLDPPGDIVGYLDVGVLTSEGIHRSCWHMINIDMP